MSSERPSAAETERHACAPASFYAMALGSVGIVYGDIGYEPALRIPRGRGGRRRIGAGHARDRARRTFHDPLGADPGGHGQIRADPLRADNNGEGGTLSLMALAFRAVGRRAPFVLILGSSGRRCFSVTASSRPLSRFFAVEGLKLVTPALGDYVVPITVLILIALFAVQRRGTAIVAAFFGPRHGVLVSAVAAVGLLHISDDPGVF